MLTKSMCISAIQQVNVVLPIGPSEECGVHTRHQCYHTLFMKHDFHSPVQLSSRCMPYAVKMSSENGSKTLLCFTRWQPHFAEETETGTSRFCIIYIILYSLCMLGGVYKIAVVLTVRLLSILGNTVGMQNCLLLCLCIGTT